MTLTYGSVCSGIEAATLAWEPLGMKAAWFAEIEKFPSSVLAHRWPDVTNYGDMTALPTFIRAGWVSAPDILVGGTPCQAFSLAGLRGGLEDPRGALTIKFVEIANAIDSVRPDDPCVVVWENVPGVLSDKTNAFGCFLAALVGEGIPLEPPGGKWANAGCVLGPQRVVAWRVLDAQYFGVAQRRRRVFVVASAREGFDPTAVLFEREGLRRDTPPSREAGEEIAPTVRAGAANGGAGHGARSGDSKDELIVPCAWGGNNTSGPIDVATACNAHGGAGRMDFETETFITDVAPTLQANGKAAGSATQQDAESGALITCFNWNAQPDQMNFSSSSTSALTCSQQAAVCLENLTVRRLMPVECELLQGMPRNHTAIPGAADGPRYKAIGNSKAVPVVRWLGARLARGAHP